jgi:hypothetical protein
MTIKYPRPSRIPLAACTYDGLGRRITKTIISGGTAVATHYFFTGSHPINLKAAKHATSRSAASTASPATRNPVGAFEKDPDC